MNVIFREHAESICTNMKEIGVDVIFLKQLITSYFIYDYID